MKVTDLLIWGGTVAGIGALGYKTFQKGQGKEVSAKVDAVMYGGLGLLGLGVALNVAMGSKAPIKLS